MTTSADSKILAILKCPICHEVFTDPKELPCLHSFCKLCIQTSIFSQKDEIIEGCGFHCPICRQFVSMPGDCTSQDEWSKQLPSSQFVRSLLDLQLMMDREKLCDICNGRNEKETATSLCSICCEAFCDECEKFHNSFKILRSHPIIPISEITEERKIRKIARDTCPVHWSMPIKIYCVDHEIPCCYTCAAVTHRKCKEVNAIEEVTRNFRDSTEMHSLLRILEEESQYVSSTLQNVSLNCNTIREQKRHIQMEISDIRTVINAHLDYLEGNLRTEINADDKVFACTTQGYEVELVQLQSAVDNCIAILDTSIEHGSDIQCLVEFSKVSGQYRKLAPLTEDKIAEFRLFYLIFKKDSSLDTLLQLPSFGKINVRGSLILAELNESKTGSSPGAVVPRFHFQCSKTMIHGIFVGDKLVVTEFNTRRIVVLNAQGDVMEKLVISGKPYQVAVIDEEVELIAVSLPCERMIPILSLKTLSLHRTITTSICCRGIDYFGNTLTVTDGERLIFLDFQQGVERSSFLHYAAMPLKLLNETELLYGDGASQVFKRREKESETLLHTNSELKGSRGVTLDMHGNIYVVGVHSRNILQISPSGDLIQIISTPSLGLNGSPWNISMKKHSGKFVIISTEGDVLVCDMNMNFVV